uniref:Retrovirus-related Pol polyprotein from transposon TNT 1-94 n=1 Tax=Tanacetum cinerariifolium TaxID=118510 RepID=A0A699GGJ8_TANCI|nr:retrovirus-related Pol polyprotein from transposon TNT 1-94 [Tanacetum cinerariifolium]
MRDELLQFKLLSVWTLVDLPKDKWAIGTKWVFRNKKDERGIVIKNKARLVAHGHTQEEGIDYDEVFAPIERIEDIRLFLAYASFKDFMFYQMDVKSAFLYEKIEDKVYVCQPPGFEDLDFPDKVYKVEKALYGLHQAPRVWTSSSIEEWWNLHQPRKICGCYSEKFDFSTIKTATTPMKPNKALIKDAEAKDIDVHLYRSMIGSLMYLIASRPDITFAVCACARFQVTPKTSHFHGVKRIFRYLKSRPKLGLWYPRDSPFDLEAYSDSDYARASLDRKSTTRGCQFLGKRSEKKEWKGLPLPASSLEAEQDSVFLGKQVEGMAKHKEIYVISSHTKKIFANMRRKGHGFSGNVTPSFETMMVLNLEEAKTAHAKEIANLKKRVKKEKDSLGTHKEASKQGRSIEDIDQDAEIALVNEAQGRIHDAYMFGVDDLEGNEVFVDVREKIVEKEVSTADLVTTAGEVVTTVSVEDSVAPSTATITDVDDELTLAKTLIAIKAAKPKVISTAATTVTTDITTSRAKGFVFYEQVHAHIPTISSSKDKGKAKMIELEKPLKKKNQIALDQEVARRQIAKQIQAQEREQLSIKERSKLLVELIRSRRSLQESKYLCGYKYKKYGGKPKTQAEVTEGSSKKAGQELEQESVKNQKLAKQEQAKVADDDIAELKRCLEIVPEDDDDVAIEATPLSSKSPTIVDYNIYRKGKKSYFKIIRADGNLQNYLTFGTMFKNFNIEDLEVLRSIFKERFKKTKSVDDMDNLLFQTIKTMFELHVEDIIWKYQQGAVKVNNWKLFDSCRVYCVTTKTMVYYLLVEKMYPFTNAILHQLWSNLVLLVYKVTAVFNKVNAAKSRVTTAVRVSTVGWIKRLEEQDMRATAKVKTINGEEQIQALVDKKKVIITETSVRSDLHLDDDEGTECLPTTTIFEQLTLMGYENLTQKLALYKDFFSPQWKFLTHTILLCLGSKTTAWNEFSSTMAFAIICLATNQNFNFSKYIFDHMVKNLEDGVKFLMFLRFLQVFLDSQVEGMLKHKEIYVTPSHTKTIFTNMKRQRKYFSGKVTPLFETMMKQRSKKSKKRIIEVPHLSDSTHDVANKHVATTSNDPLLSGEDRLKLTKLMELYTKLQSRVLALETTKANQALEIGSLKRRVKKLEKKASKKTHKLKRLYKIGFSTRVESSKDADMFDTSIFDDEEVVAEEVVVEKEVSTADLVPTTGEVVPTASEVVTTVGAEAKGIMIQDPSETPTPTPIDSSQQSSKAKDKGKAKMIEPKKPLKRKKQIMIDEEIAINLKSHMQAELEEEETLARQKEKEDNIALIESWDNTQAMMDADCELPARLQEEKRGEFSIEEKSRLFVELMDKRKKHFARLRAERIKNTELVKGSEKAAEGSEKAAEGSEKAKKGSSKRASDKLEQEDAKRQRIEEENESTEFKRCLEIIPDDNGDDVTIEATPLSFTSLTLFIIRSTKKGEKSFLKSSKHMVDYKIEMTYDLLRLIRRKINEGYVPK